MKQNKMRLKPIAGCILALLIQPATAALVSISDSPLVVSGAIEPNIMFLVDNSGSMSNIVPDAPYDPTITYFTCSTAPQVAAGSTIHIRITGSGTPYFYNGSNRDWGTTSGTGATGHSKRCFDPNENYFARLYGNSGGSSSTKSTSGYLWAQYTGNYLNWYFGSAPTNWGSGARNKPGTERRMDIAKDASKNMIDSLNGVRVGLASYNVSSGATINQPINNITTNRAAMKSSIDALSPSGSTPLGESLRDIGQYFTQGYSGTLKIHPGESTTAGDLFNESTVSQSNFFARDGAYSFSPPSSAPIQAFCQKNFAVLLTDGRPQSDQSMSSYLEDYDGDCIAASPSCNSHDQKPSQVYESAGSDYLDDVAKALFEIDLRPDLDDFNGNEVVNNIRTYTIGFADDQVINDPLMQDTANNGGGLFKTAANSAELADAFKQAVANVNNQISSAASAALNTGFISGSTKAYQAKFDTANWRGDLSAIPINLSDGTLNLAGAISASNNLPVPGSRAIITFDTTLASGSNPLYGDGAAFVWSDLNASQQATLNKDSAGTTDGQGSNRLDYLRGDESQETANGGAFRTRPLGKLGDFVHSAPVYVQKPPFRYPDNWGASAPENAKPYSAFKTSKSSRTSMVYLGGNDGMLHGFNATTMVEKLAYVPQAVFSSLSELTDPSYTHKFLVDGSPTVGDAYFNGDWHTVLVGGLNKGGQGIYALDVTNPGTFSEANAASIVLWEFRDVDDTDATTAMEYGLGYTYSQPAIVRMHNGKWAAVFGNGYNNSEADGRASTSGHAILYILDLETGTVIKKIDTGVGSPATPNGLATPAPVDLDGDNIVDVIYAGDLQGNMWKFNVTNSNASLWDSAYKSGGANQPLYTALDASGNGQPITVRPEVGLAPPGRGVMVYFGTGLYLGASDLTNSDVQTFYGIIDEGSAVTGDRNNTSFNLLSQTLDGTKSTTAVRILTDNKLTGTNDGWYFDLPASTERVTANPVLRGGRIIFVTLIPDSRLCGFGGTGWLMELNATHGGRTLIPPFDLDGVPGFDKFNGDIPGGVSSTVGILTTPGILVADDKEYKYNTGSSGAVQTTTESPGAGNRGRQSWRQLR